MQTPEEHHAALESFMGFMRERGLQRYRGPLFGVGWHVDVDLELGPAPHVALAAAPTPPAEETLPPKRHRDGLTSAEQELAYGHAIED